MDKTKLYHFVGIKGSGMSALALIMHGKGFRVQGSDVTEYFFTQKGLEDVGITILPFDANNIQADNMIVIAGNAFPDTHEEIARAFELGVEVVRYHTFIGQLMTGYESIAITGSHGKTTTTGLVSHVFRSICPTSFLIGDGTGRGVENATHFVMEACEYREHFLAYHPNYAIITNVDFDHPDYYENIDHVYGAFVNFSKQVSKRIIACGEDAYLRRMADNPKMFYYGFEHADGFPMNAIAKNVKRSTEGSSFDAYMDGEFYGHFTVPAFGKHNVLNALATVSVAYLEGLPSDEVAKALRSFSGVKRRFSQQTIGDVIVIDDYAHHPSEIAATLDAARQKYPNKQIIAAFQPHTFTRTVALLQEFADILSTADAVYLFEIFASEREESGTVSIEDLRALIPNKAVVLDKNHLSPLLNYRDAVILFMGAGSIDKVSSEYARLLSQSQATNS